MQRILDHSRRQGRTTRSVAEEFLDRIGQTIYLSATPGDYELAKGGGADNVVEVYVGYVRRKIGAERLVTVRGAGYRLVG